MKQSISHIAWVVNDYDEAIKFYTEQLDFRLIEDTKLSETKRWVMVAPPGATECCLLLAKAADDQQRARVGNHTGGRVFLFLFTDDFWRDYHTMQGRQNCLATLHRSYHELEESYPIKLRSSKKAISHYC